MGIFSSKIELNKIIKEQEEKISELTSQNMKQKEKVQELERKLKDSSFKNMEYERKYVQTNIECDSCYYILQKEFCYCPKCGKKVEKNVEKSECSNSNIFQVENDGNSCLIVGYKGFKDKKIVIPSEINGRPVIGIYNNVFEKCEYIEEVIFEDGCQYIGECAFSECFAIKKVKFPKSLREIGAAAFYGNRELKEVIVPANVKFIGSSAFSSCTSLERVILPEGLPIITQSMLSNTAIKEINIPESVRIIDNGAFGRTALCEVALPEQLRMIDNWAFSECRYLKKIVMHSNIEMLCKGIFDGSTPVVYCAGGSKAQLYARKYNLECEEIKSVPHKDKNAIGVQWIDVEKNARKMVNGRQVVETLYDINTWIKMIGVSKAEAYPYKVDKTAYFNHKISLHKYYTYDEAINIQRNLESKGFSVRLFDYWGECYCSVISQIR